jgi:hypothetical protein
MISILKGRVKDTEDPIKSGRIRVEIPGVFDFPDTNQYPWISYMNPFPCGSDSGMFMVPEVGDFVVVLGLEDSYESSEYFCIGSWNTSSDKPQEAINNTTKVLYKSVTGHTIELDDTLENEKFRLIDRAGQIFEFLCSIKKDSGKRGTGNVIDGNSKTLDDLVEKAIIRIKDLYGSEWVMQSKSDDSKFYFRHKDGNEIEVNKDSMTVKDHSQNKITLNAVSGSEYVEVVSKFGSIIKMEENTVTVQANDNAKIVISLSDNSISIESSGAVEVSSASAKIESSGQVEIIGSQVVLNNGAGGIHSSVNHPVDYFTGAPLNGSPTEKSN